MLNTKTIGNRITDARKRLNISQSRLAGQLFISSQAVGKWERGESLPDIITLIRLAEILGVDLNYFSEDPTAGNTDKASTGFAQNAAGFPDNTLEGLSGNQQDEMNSADQSVNQSIRHSAKESAKQKEKPRWDMSSGNWVDADFSGLNNLHEKFSASNMQRCKFIGSDLSGLLLKNNHVDSCDFSGSAISGSHIKSSHLNKNIFKGCSLNNTEFSRSFLNRCDFSGTNLTDAEFIESFIYGCDLTGVDFTGVVMKSGGFTGVVSKSGDHGKNTITSATWNRTSFMNTQIADLVLEGTMEDCSFENCTFTRVTFQNATLINTFFKNNKNLKRIKFLECKADRMTYEFLKQGKADLNGITLVS